MNLETTLFLKVKGNEVTLCFLSLKPSVRCSVRTDDLLVEQDTDALEKEMNYQCQGNLFEMLTSAFPLHTYKEMKAA